MANSRSVNVACPNCSKESTFIIWQNVSSIEDPMLKKQILDGTLFDFKCPYCEYSVALHYDLLFNMADRGVMLHLINDEEQAKNVPAMIEAQEASLPREAQESAKKYIHRIVPDILSLREKAIIFENDLDDRVIELMKVVYCGQFEEQKGITVQHIFFSANGDNWQFELFGESELLAIAPFDKNLYTSLQHAPKRKLKPIRNDRRYFVDREWAVKSIE